jgi:FG-GAP repeat/FG-GAP-like repeat
MRPSRVSRFLTLILLSPSALGCGGAPGARTAAPDGGTPVEAGTSDGAVTPPDGPSLPSTAALRLIAPLSTATVTSQQPTLHWALGPTCDGARVQVCRDRGCTRQVAAFDAAGASGAPPTALPNGVLYWRARALQGDAGVEGWTPIWQFTVGARSAPVDTSWGTTLDVNGDGYADVAVGAPGAGQVSVYLGGPSGPPASPTSLLTGTAGDSFGLFVASAGDVNGDGYADLLVGGGSLAYLFTGGPSGLGASASTTLTLPQPAETGVRVTSAGDVNGDGYADVALANYDMGIVYVYLGGPSGLAASPAATLPSPSVNVATGAGPGGGFGHSIASAGDLNGDGYGDIVVGAPPADQNGQAYVYLGGPQGIAQAPAFTLTGPDGPSRSFGNSVSCADDVDGDGYADLVVGEEGADGTTTGDLAGRAYVYLGGPAGVAPSPAVSLIGPETLGTFGRWVSRAGDVNGDGYADVIVGADAEYGSGDTAPGWAYVYLGGASGLSATPAITLTGPDGLGSWFGRCVAGAGDVNGDGYADVIIGADAGGVVLPADAGSTGAAGWAYVFLGNASGVASSPAVRWVGPSNTSIFGRAVAGIVRAWRGGRSG